MGEPFLSPFSQICRRLRMFINIKNNNIYIMYNGFRRCRTIMRLNLFLFLI